MKSIRTSIFLLTRNLYRSSIAVTIVIIVIFASVLVNQVMVTSLLRGFTTATKDKLIDYTYSDIIIRPQAGESFIENSNILLSELSDMQEVSAATSRLRLAGQFKSDQYTGNYEVIFINPEQDREVFSLSTNIISGEFLTDNITDIDELVLGIQIAGNNNREIELYSQSLKNITPGDNLEIKFANYGIDSFPISENYNVIGITDVGYIPPDLVAYGNKNDFVKNNANYENLATELNIKLNNAKDNELFIEKLQEKYPNLIIESWKDNQGVVINIKESFTTIQGIFKTIAIIIAILFIFVITYIDTQNRKKQIGIQRAIGINRFVIINFYILKNLILTSAGIILGTFLMLFVFEPIFQLYPFNFPFGEASLDIKIVDFIEAGVLMFSTTLVISFVVVYAQLKISITNAIWNSN